MRRVSGAGREQLPVHEGLKGDSRGELQVRGAGPGDAVYAWIPDDVRAREGPRWSARSQGDGDSGDRGLFAVEHGVQRLPDDAVARERRPPGRRGWRGVTTYDEKLEVYLGSKDWTYTRNAQIWRKFACS